MRPFLQTIHRATTACAFVAALAFTGSARANLLDTTTWLNGSMDVTVHRGAVDQNVRAGGFTGVLHSGGTPDITTPIVFWCFELTQNFVLGNSYDYYMPTSLGGPVGTQIARLFEEAFLTAGSSTINSVAFQLAVWEIEYDGASLDVTSGSGFRVTGAGAAATQANTWLSHLGSYTGNGVQITELIHRDRQDFIFGSSPPSECCGRVPEPPMLPLVLAAMGAWAIVESRRRLRTRGE